MDSLKRTLKAMFKLGKKNKQEQEHAALSSPQHHAATTDDLPKTPPQLPPVQSASPLQSPSPAEATKPLPPTHPLATGQHSHPQEAVPQNHDARPGPPPPPTTGTAAATSTETTAAPTAEMSPPTLKSEAGAAALDREAAAPKDSSTAPLTTTSLPAAEQAPSDTTASSVPNGSFEQATKTDSGFAEAHHDTVSKENMDPKVDATKAISEEKTLIVHEEPPPIKAIQVAPGMSATSGPLEDFPEGGENLREE